MSTTPQTNEVVKQEAPAALSQIPLNRNGVQLTSIEDLFRFSRAVVAAGLCPKGLEKPESVFIAIQMGLELGISPMAALQNIGVINGKPKIYGSMPLALVRASGQLEWIKETIEGTGDNRKAVCTTKRRGESDPKTTTFSVQDAKIAGLWGTNTWAKYPDRMLMYRARGFNLDDNFSDVLKGMAVHEPVIDLPAESVTRVDPSKYPLDENCSLVEPKEVNASPQPIGFRGAKSYQKLLDGFKAWNWREVEVHFDLPAGPALFAIKGKSLGKIEKEIPKAFEVLLLWEPKEVEGKHKLEDLALRAALDAAAIDLKTAKEQASKS